MLSCGNYSPCLEDSAFVLFLWGNSENSEENVELKESEITRGQMWKTILLLDVV